MTLPSVSVPKCLSFIASCLVQEGIVVTVEYQGQGSSELDVIYHVHLDHRSNEDCTIGCNTVKLQDFLQNPSLDAEEVTDKHIGTYVSSAQSKLLSMIRNFVKVKNSDLHSKAFHFEQCYSLNGSITLKGYLWPVALNDMNKEFSTYPEVEISEDIRSDYINYINKIICVTTDPCELTEVYNLSEMEAVRIADMANQTQFHYCKDLDCTREPFLPSLITLLVEMPVEHEANIKTAEKFNAIMLQKLNELSIDEVQRLSSYDWLNDFFNSVHGDVIDKSILQVQMENEEFEFFVDSRMLSLFDEFSHPLIAVYHYAISCGPLVKACSLVMRRVNIR